MCPLGLYGVGLFALFIITVAILAFVFWILMIIDCVKREFKNPNDKIVWMLVIILLQLLGAVIYWFVVKNKIPPQPNNNDLN